MITIYEWRVTTEFDTLMAIGVLTGTREDAEAYARNAVFPTGKPLTDAEKKYKFKIQQIIKPRRNENTADNYTRPEKERIPQTLSRRTGTDHVHSCRPKWNEPRVAHRRAQD